MDFLLKKVKLAVLHATEMEMWKTFPFYRTLNVPGFIYHLLDTTSAGNLEIEAICESAERNIQTKLQVEEPNREKLGKPTNQSHLNNLQI